MSKIKFTINFETNLKHKFEKYLTRYESEIKCKLMSLKIDKYYKIDGQYQATFLVDNNFDSKELLIYEILRMANQLWSTGYYKWTFHGPFESNNLHFECILNIEDDDQPLKWAHIELIHD